MSPRGAPGAVIIGGGVVGCASAYFLSGEGFEVTLVERDSVASHASGFAYGGLSPVMGIIVDDPVLPLSDAGARLHAELAGTLPAESGVDYEYRAKKGLTLALSASEVEGLRVAYDWLTAHHDGEVRWFDRDALLALEPRVGESAIAGLFTDRSSEVEPYRFTLALWQAAEKRGAVMRNARVNGLVRTGGAVTGVRLEGGGEIHAGAVVLAAGPWSGEAAAWLGIDLPVSPLKGQILRLKAPGDPLAVSLSWADNYATTKPDGLLWAGTTEEHAGFDENPSAAGRDAIMRALVDVLPYLAEAELVQHTACLRPVAPDGLPVIGPAPGCQGAFIATGAGRKGILLGPAMGRTVADLVMSRPAPFDISGLSPDRFGA